MAHLKAEARPKKGSGRYAQSRKTRHFRFLQHSDANNLQWGADLESTKVK